MTITYLVEKLGPYHDFRLSSIEDHLLTIIETRPDSKRYGWKEELNLKTFHLPSKSTHKQLWKLIEDSNPELLFISGYGFIEMLWAMAYGVKKNIAMVLLSDSTALEASKSRIKEWIKAFLVRQTQAALVAGIRSRKYLNSLGIQDPYIFQPYDIVDNAYYTQKTSSSPLQKPYFICISRLIPPKNLPFLIETFSEYVQRTKDPIKLIILGDGELEIPLKERIKSLGMDSQIELKGFLINSEVRRYYQWAEALILASSSEPWGLCINEAIAAGIPVLSTVQAGAVEDLIFEGITGYTFSPFNQESLIEKMNLIRNISAKERLTLIEKAQLRLENFDIAHFKMGFNEAAQMAKNRKRKRKPLMAYLNIQIILLISRFAF